MESKDSDLVLEDSHAAAEKKEQENYDYPFPRPFFPTDIWLHNIIPHLDGPSLLQLSLCCKDNYKVFVSSTLHPVKHCDDDDLGRYGWEICCRQRWPSVKQFPIAISDVKIQRFHKWYECYRRMHKQDRKVDSILSILLSRNKTQNDCIDLLYDLFCSDIAVDQLFDGLLQKCLVHTSLTTTTSPSIAPSRVMAGLMLLEVNQLFSMQRLCNLWARNNTPSTSSSGLILKGALLIAQFCQSVSELIQRRSLYALEEEFHGKINAIADRMNIKLNRKRGKTLHDSHEYVHWVEEMKQLFLEASDSSLIRHPCDEDSIPFCGNTDNYYDWHNSLMDKVIKNRKGIPITLCIIYAAIIHRALGVDLDFIGLPGHFLLRLPLHQTGEGQDLSTSDSSHMMIFIDAFNGGRIYNIQEVRDIVEIRYGIPWSEKYISPLTPEKVWSRMIGNIVNTARDYSTPSQTVLLEVVKRRLDITHFPPPHEMNVEEITHRFFHLSPLCSFESDDILALSHE